MKLVSKINYKLKYNFNTIYITILSKYQIGNWND